MASRGQKIVSMVTLENRELPESNPVPSRDAQDVMSPEFEPLPSLERENISQDLSTCVSGSQSTVLPTSQLDGPTTSRARNNLQKELLSTLSSQPATLSSQPSTSSSQPSTSLSQPSTSSAQPLTSVSSSDEESDLYEDSGESYRPSESEQDELSGELSSNNSGNENNEVDSDENNELAAGENNEAVADRWGPCSDIPVAFQFSGQSGMKVNTIDLANPYDIYRQFVTDEVLDIIVSETNRYATQYLQSHVLRPRSMFRKWKETNRDEIRRFLGIMMIMGINHLPKMRLYWSNNDIFANKLIQKTMKHDRFDCLLKFFHLANNEDPAANIDRLRKVRNIINLICDQFKKTLTPGENVVIDETMVPWRGRLVFRQYLPAKSHKYGIKVYKICTPEGYTYNLQIYAGKNTPDAPDNNRGHTYNVCMDLLRGLLNEGRILYIDNYYTSVQLSKAFLDSKTYVCGTLRTNRKGNPQTVCKKMLRKGEMYAEQNQEGIRIVKWIDKRPVLMISTVPSHTAELKSTGGKNRRGEDILKPSAVIAYNKAKKGVDVSDQMSAYYTCLRKTIKWYKKVFFEILLGTCVVNTWVVYNEYGGNIKKMDMLQLREKVLRGLLGTENEIVEPENDDNEAQQQRRRPRSSSNLVQHKMGKYEGSVRNSRKRCLSCYQNLQSTSSTKDARNKTKRVSTFCQDCPGQPTMCLKCFNEKHK